MGVRLNIKTVNLSKICSCPTRSLLPTSKKSCPSLPPNIINLLVPLISSPNIQTRIIRSQPSIIPIDTLTNHENTRKDWLKEEVPRHHHHHHHHQELRQNLLLSR